MADQPLPRIVSTPDTCFGQPRFDGTRLTVSTFLGAVIFRGVTEADILLDYPDFPVGGVEALRAEYAANKDWWEMRWAVAEAANEAADCCSAATVLPELLEALKASSQERPVATLSVLAVWRHGGTIPVDEAAPLDYALHQALQRAEATVEERDG